MMELTVQETILKEMDKSILNHEEVLKQSKIVAKEFMLKNYKTFAKQYENKFNAPTRFTNMYEWAGIIFTILLNDKSNNFYVEKRRTVYIMHFKEKNEKFYAVESFPIKLKDMSLLLNTVSWLQHVVGKETLNLVML